MSNNIVQNSLLVARNHNIPQRIFLGMATLCTVLSVFNPLRRGACLALRGMALLSTASDSPKRQGAVLKTVKITAITLGIVGLAASMPLMMIGSLGVDIASQVGSTARSIFRKEFFKSLIHTHLIVIDTLALLGFALASWKLMVAATVVNSFTMLTLLSAALVNEQIDIGICSSVLLVASIISNLCIGKKSSPLREVTVKSNHPNEQIIVDEPLGGRGIIAVGEPGKSVTFINRNRAYRAFYITRISPNGIKDERFEVPFEVTRQPLSPSLFGAIPVGGPATGTIEQQEIDIT